jgi:hypothetical protein
MKARILLKADVGEGGEGRSDNRIIEAVGASVSMLYRWRRAWTLSWATTGHAGSAEDL